MSIKKDLKIELINWVSNSGKTSGKTYEEKQNDKFIMIKKVFEYHYDNNKFYNGYCNSLGITPDDLVESGDIYKIPTIPVENFKKADSAKLLTCDVDEIEMEMKSTGTSGIPSVSRRCGDTVDIASHAFLSSYRENFKLSKGVGLYLFPSAAEVPEMGMVKILNYFSGMLDETFTAMTGSKLLFKEAAMFLNKFEGKTTRHIFGPPFLIMKFLNYCNKNNIAINLDEKSFVVTLGGWKRYTGDMISIDEFKNELKDSFSVSKSNIRDMYGLSECNFLAIENDSGSKVVPFYVDFINFDYKNQTQKIKDNKGKGVLKIYDPTILSYPCFVHTTDVVSLSYDNQNQYINYLTRVKGAEFGCCAVNLDSFVKECELNE